MTTIKANTPQEPPTVSQMAPPQSASASALATTKPIHSLILDAGPLIQNDPPLSTLLNRAETLYTIPAVLAEIRDENTRQRVETQLLPFVTVRTPRGESVRFVSEFARRTGDLEVLSRPDLQLLGLAYEVECERNGGDWRLRRDPGQKRVNGKPPGREEGKEELREKKEEEEKKNKIADVVQSEPVLVDDEQDTEEWEQVKTTKKGGKKARKGNARHMDDDDSSMPIDQLTNLVLEPSTTQNQTDQKEEEDADSNSDSEGWITPSNFSQHQSQSPSSQPIQKTLQSALLTSDYAMQNVALRINLNLLSPQLSRITRLKTHVHRCHACFHTTPVMSRQFCQRCGQPTLTRVSCSIDAATGLQKLHLKANFQWNKRGNVYSIPKPTHGTANGKYRGQGGGKEGWGNGLILTGDQKEYVKAVEEKRKERGRDLWDEDYLPGILSGERRGTGNGKVKVGAGRNVNARKR